MKLPSLTAFLQRESKNFVRIPLENKSGRLYVSPMPFGPYDKFNEIINSYRRHRVDRVIALVTDEEHQKKSKKNIWKVYEKLGIKVTRLPFKDLLSPLIPEVANLVDNTSGYLDSERVVIHCNAGVGRSGLIASCIVARVHKVAGEIAIEYVKQFMQTDLTDEQKRFVKRWAEEVQTEMQSKKQK